MNQPIFLRIFSGQHLVAVKQFDSTQVVFGRDAQVDVDLSDEKISNIHAMIEERDGDYYICDLGSREGTKVNQEAILDKKIVSGDIIELGTFKIEFYIGIPKPKAKPAKTVVPTPPAAPDSPPSSDQIEHAKEDTLLTDAKDLEEAGVPKPEAPEDNDVEEVSQVVSEEEIEKKVIPDVPEPQTKAYDIPKVVPGREMTMSSVPGQEPADVDPSGNVSPSAKRPKRRLTYAPPSSYSSLDEVIKPGKGVLIDVMVAWGDRVIETHRISKEGQVSIGSHPKNDIVLPSLDGIIQSQPFISGANSVSQVFVPKNKRGHLLLGKKQKLSFEEAVERGRAQDNGSFWVIELQQEELIRIEYGKGLSVYITHANQAPDVIMGGLSTAEIMAIAGAVIISLLLYFISTTLAPSQEDLEEEKDKKIRVTKFEFTRNEPIPKKKIVKISDKKTTTRSVKTPSKVQTNRKKKLKGDPGKASELRPNKNRIRDKKNLAAEKKGKASVRNTRRAGPKSKNKGQNNSKKKKETPADLGLAGYFAKQGAQAKLNKVVKGKNNVLGASQRATGAGGGAGGAGIDAGLKNVSKGGKGEATIGKQRVDTKGKNNGLGDFGEGGLGQKGTTNVDIGGEGTEFVGTIDKEAVRRVIRANIAQVRACYEEELNKDLSLYGKVVVSWEILAKGRVGRAFVKSSTLKNSNVEKCIVRRLKTWRFPIPPKGATARIAYPFVFSAR